MENMEKELTVPKWVLINSPAENTPNASNNFSSKWSAQAQKFRIFENKSSLWVSVVHSYNDNGT